MIIQVSEMEERIFYSLSAVTVYYCNTFYRNVINNCNSVILFAFFVELTNHTACSYVKVETNTQVWSSFMEVLVVLCITFFFSVSLSRRRNFVAKRSVDLELIHVPMFLSGCPGSSATRQNSKFGLENQRSIHLPFKGWCIEHIGISTRLIWVSFYYYLLSQTYVLCLMYHMYHAINLPKYSPDIGLSEKTLSRKGGTNVFLALSLQYL